MKYFFLTQGWTVGRVWEFGGLWNELVWRRSPQIERLNLALVEPCGDRGAPSELEYLWLYGVEEAVLMVEVKPPIVTPAALAAQLPAPTAIGRVILKELITADQVLDRLQTASGIQVWRS
ncbi:MAG: hypothetical protein VKK80_16010 [Prochlorothrix sp.]|nr:hypothetical protein [Prochlorothrix sp.]